MRRVSDPAADLQWLGDRPDLEAITGYDPEGWPASVWILHAMYENGALDGSGTYDEHHRALVSSDSVPPATVGDINLTEVSTLTGIPLGFVVRPGPPWKRLLWQEYLTRQETFSPNIATPPSASWFPRGSWPLTVAPPPEGSLDEASLDELLDVLSERSPHGADTTCLAFYGALPAGDFDVPHVWEGPLRAIGDLVNDRGGTYGSSPTNFWPRDRSWFVWTDWDLLGTKVSGDRTLISAIAERRQIETVTWPSSDPFRPSDHDQ